MGGNIFASKPYVFNRSRRRTLKNIVFYSTVMDIFVHAPATNWQARSFPLLVVDFDVSCREAGEAIFFP